MNHKPSPSPPRAAPVTPDALRLQDALRRSAPLARLQELMRESTARFDAIAPALPAGLAAHVRPGPLDETGTWSLLAANAAVAAKLRQLKPRLEALLRERGCEPSAIRIRVQSG